MDLWYIQFVSKKLDQTHPALIAREMAFHVSLVGRKHLSREIYLQILRAIRTGRLRPGDRLSPSRELSRTLEVSRMTVTVAYEQLAGEGFIKSRRGGGTFVSDFAVRSSGSPTLSSRSNALRPHPQWESVVVADPFKHPAKFDFRTGLPDTSAFPFQAWHRSVLRAMPSDGKTAGVYEHPAGRRHLREMIARHIGFSRGVAASAEDFVITNGTQQALDVLARALLQPGDTIAVEDPGYQPPIRLFRSLGLVVVGVPVDRDGLVVDALPPAARAVYVTPSHQYPLAVSLSLPRRHALLAWAERHNAAIIEDDYDCEFRFKGRPLEPLQTLDTQGRVIYVGSFSKTMLPTLRLGFLLAPRALLPALHKAKFVCDWHTSSLVQAGVARFIEAGEFARHIRRMTRIYRERYEILANAVTSEFASHLELIPSAAGLHLAAFARKASATQLEAIARRAADRGVAIQLLSACAVSATARAGVMLGYGAIPTARIREGLRLLRTCFDQ